MGDSTGIRSAAALAGFVLCCALVAVQSDEIYVEDEAFAVVDVQPVEGASFGWPGSMKSLRLRHTLAGDLLEVKRGGTWVNLRGPCTAIGSFAAAGWDADGPAMIVWDEYAGQGGPDAGGSYDVFGVSRIDGVLGDPFVVAAGARFQARPTVALNSLGEFLVAFEEGPANWGGTYRSVDRAWNNATDTCGPLHSWRQVRLCRVLASGDYYELPVPMPAFDRQAAEDDRRPGADRVGVFYERPVVASSGEHFYLAYRHVHQRESSLQLPKLTSHVEHGFGVYARLVDARGVHRALRFSERQRDGEQRLAMVTDGDGVMRLFYETGRRDRRGDSQHAGVVSAALSSTPVESGEGMGLSSADEVAAPKRESVPAPSAWMSSRERPSASVLGERFTLLFGDLHRHTDLSLCFPFFDGSVDDAYRYARGPGALDFLAVTDHARDLDNGKGTSRPWKLHVAAADRYHVPGRFSAFRAYERSQSDTDHNVIGMRADADFLRPHQPPLQEFWDEFTADEVLTIPHATSWRDGMRFCGDVWQKRDDERRPIAEIYQGGRDVSSMEELQRAALTKGQKLGFIASSDHMSTSSSYACVWAGGDAVSSIDRQPIYDALRARRCYGATDRIELRVTATVAGEVSQGAGPFWMGEDLPSAAAFDVRVGVKGTAAIGTVEFWSDGELVHAVAGKARLAEELTWRWEPDSESQSYLFVRIVQTDGEEAWASPFFHRWADR